MPISKQKAKLQVKEYIKNNGNAKKTILALEPHLKEDYAGLKAHRMINSDTFNEVLQEEMDSKGLNEQFIERIIKRNSSQSKNINASNQAIDIALKVRGGYKPEEKKILNLNIDLNNEQAIQDRLKELDNELARLKDAS